MQHVRGAVPAVDADEGAVREAPAHAAVCKRGEHPHATHCLARMNSAVKHRSAVVIGGRSGRLCGGCGARQHGDGVLSANEAV